MELILQMALQGLLMRVRSLVSSITVHLLFPGSYKMQKASCCMPSSSHRYLDNDGSLIYSLLMNATTCRNLFLINLGEKGKFLM